MSGAAAAQPVREEATFSRSGIGINVYRVKGAAIEYARALRLGSAAFPQGALNSEVDKLALINNANTAYEFAITYKA